MIISLSGKIGSGKDLTAKIIQALIDKSGCFDKLKEVDEKDVDYYVWDEPTFKLRKFATKLKQMVCILLGCTLEDLEDRKFKEKELGEEWKCFEIYNSETYNIVKKVLTKNKAMDFIEDNHEFHFYQVRERTLTPRLLLQLLGTECGREILHPNIWVNSLMSEYKMLSHSGPTRDLKFPNWVISDTRFPNEFEAVKSRGGLCIKVERGETNVENIHPSETALDGYTFDYVLDNNGTIKELVEKVKVILKKEKLI